nr:acyl-CoA reductase [Cytophagales bacterium]
MNHSIKEKIAGFNALGNFLKQLDEVAFESIAFQVSNNNSWFTPAHTRIALQGLGRFLDEKALADWVGGYSFPEDGSSLSIGLIMAGNVPAVGFHDLLCILIAGHSAHVKLSSSDRVLIPWLLEKLISFDPRFERQVIWEERLNGMDAYIATGSDNSSRYFDYYFGKYPHIIRKNRTSVAVLDGQETDEDLEKLANDVFLHYGLGCRNVSKIYVKSEDQLQRVLKAADKKSEVINHHKYLNNYEYNKSIYLVNREPHLDNGFLLLRECVELVSPIAVVFYEYYENEDDLSKKLGEKADKIQCVVSRQGRFPRSLPFGQAQFPGLTDYADHIDTLQFLLTLKQAVPK